MKNAFDWKYLLGGILTIAVVAFAVWFVFFRAGVATPTPTNDLFGASQNQPIATISGGSTTSTDQQSFSYVPNSQKRIFKIANGPIASAVYVQTSNPTTTIVRYIRQDSGHIFEQPLNAPGSAVRIISNTTIPGIENAVWTQQGNAVVLQYAQGNTIKTAAVNFQNVSSSTPEHVRFLPDNITSIAASPDGTHVAYLLASATGVSGYIADSAGTNSKKLFSMPLSQVTIAWPAAGTLLVQSKPAAGVPGISFSVSAKTGTYAPLLYTSGLTETANSDFSSILYQTDASGARVSYAHDLATGKDIALSGQPLPEKCAWSPRVHAALICAVPLSYVPVNYIDLWHQGVASVADQLVGYNLDTRADVAIGTPGKSADGGSAADIGYLSISQDGNYVLYINKVERALWGVQLDQ